MAPPAFSELEFEEALERSRENQSVMIVDAMATWCAPCRQMDETTWVDDAVVSRLTGEGSFAIQIDVDAEEELAIELGIRSMPTLIAFRSGVEHDRLVGGRGPKELLEWLDIVERGETFEGVQRARQAQAIERIARAKALVEFERYDEALAEYRSIWSDTPDPRLVDDIRALARAHAPSRAAFTTLRDAAAPTPATSVEEVYIWILLNQILDDDAATLTWYSGADLPATRMAAGLLELTIVPLMMRCGRWTDAGAALADPRAAFRRLVDARREDFRTETANLLRALHAAGREELASDLEYEAESVDSSAEMTAALAQAKVSGRTDRAQRAR